MVYQILQQAKQQGATDVHFSYDLLPMMRLHGALYPMEYERGYEQFLDWVPQCLTEEQQVLLKQGQDIDTCMVDRENHRYRVSLYHQRQHLTGAIRILYDDVLSIEQLSLPKILQQLAMLPRGLVLVTGPSGSGKSTTLAAMIQYINQNKSCHILTIEDPIEYSYQSDKAMIHQREIGDDISSYHLALRSALRADPDVIFIGEIRDFETMEAAVTAAETGHLVLSTLHTFGAAQTIDRIIDIYPAGQQQQIRSQLAEVLQAVVSQQLLPKKDGNGLVVACEVMRRSDGIANVIRQGKTHQIPAIIQTSATQEMVCLDCALATLVKQGKISRSMAEQSAMDLQVLQQYLKGEGVLL